MNTTLNNSIPSEISEYIQQFFGQDCITQTYTLRRKEDLFYCADIGKNGNLHHLVFNDDGVLLKQETKEILPPGANEGFYGEEQYYENYCD